MKFFVYFCLLLSFDLGFAQDKPKEHTCRILFLQRPVDAPEELFMFDGATAQKVELSSMNFSPVYKIQGGNIVLSLTPNSIIKPEDLPKGAPLVRIPEGMLDFYLLIASDPENKITPIKALVVDAGSEKIKNGETLWINLTSHTIAAKLGDKITTIKPQARIIGKPPLDTSGYFKAEFMFKTDDMTGFQPIMKKSWWFDAESKNLGFIYNTGTYLPKIISFRDKRDPEPTKEEKAAAAAEAVE